MFQFPALAPFRVMEYDLHRVSPFGNPRIDACLQLPEAYRSLPRPSSPARAQASTVCTSILDQHSAVARRPRLPTSLTKKPSQQHRHWTPGPDNVVQGPPKALTTLSTSVFKQRALRFRATSRAGYMRTEVSSVLSG
jgi:hypothetical protein